MFSGIVETIGTISYLQLLRDCLLLTITPHIPFDDIKIGDSIAVNGTCLTVTHLDHHGFSVTVVPETLALTNLAQLKVGNIVNLERSLKVNSRMGGHYVQGHIDGMGKILNLTKISGQDAWLAKISLPEKLTQYVVNKGYITLDGMSITVIEAQSDWFTVTFIPHTQKITITEQYQVGSAINIEVDILGKYVEKLLRAD